MRDELAKNIVPEVHRIASVVREQQQGIKQQRAALAQVKVDPTDSAAAALRGEMRAFLRTLPATERMTHLTNDPDDRMIQAALEAPVLAGLSREMRDRVEEVHIRRTHVAKLRSLDDHEEVLDLLVAAAKIATREIYSNLNMTETEFTSWFATAGGTDTRRAA